MQTTTGIHQEGIAAAVREIIAALGKDASRDGLGQPVCMTMRGVQKPGAATTTSAIRGGFRRRGVTRSEFLSLVQGK